MSDTRKDSPRAPRMARTNRQIRALARDNVSTRDYWILVDEGSVTISKQRSGQTRTEHVTISRAAFDRFVDWYNTGRFRNARKRAVANA